MWRPRVRGDDLDAGFAAASSAAAPRFLHRHQEAERVILELQVPQHVPVFAHVFLQELEHVPEADDAAWWNGRSGWKGAESDEADDDPRGKRGRAVRQKIGDDLIAVEIRVAEAADDR